MKKLNKIVAILLMIAFLFPVTSIISANEAHADAPKVWFYGKSDDSKLNHLVGTLKRIVGELWDRFWSFDWLKHPRIFYRNLKHLAQVWYRTMVALFDNLSGHVRELEHELAKDQCRTPACTNVGHY